MVILIVHNVSNLTAGYKYIKFSHYKTLYLSMYLSKIIFSYNFLTEDCRFAVMVLCTLRNGLSDIRFVLEFSLAVHI